MLVLMFMALCMSTFDQLLGWLQFISTAEEPLMPHIEFESLPGEMVHVMHHWPSVVSQNVLNFSPITSS